MFHCNKMPPAEIHQVGHSRRKFFPSTIEKRKTPIQWPRVGGEKLRRLRYFGFQKKKKSFLGFYDLHYLFSVTSHTYIERR